MRGMKGLRLDCSLLVPVVVLLGCGAALAQKPEYRGVGATPTPEQLRAWDITIGPSGKELPPGKGTAKEGGVLFAQKCSVCHGPTGEESKLTYARLVGGIGSLTTDDPVITPGEYLAVCDVHMGLYPPRYARNSGRAKFSAARLPTYRISDPRKE